jgi:hypothetical protein
MLEIELKTRLAKDGARCKTKRPEVDRAAANPEQALEHCRHFGAVILER